eukprot:COSAG01_NODE_188_length_22632_cov_15.284915_17_plen_146_part_00
MRLAPVPIFFAAAAADGGGAAAEVAEVVAALEPCCRYARESSYTTHPGEIAAECCALLAFLVARAIHDPQLPPAAPAVPVPVQMPPPGSAADGTDGGGGDGEGGGGIARGWLVRECDFYAAHVLAAREAGSPGCGSRCVLFGGPF